VSRLLVAADPPGAATLAAEEVGRRLQGAVACRGRAVVALAGGATPRLLHGRLADPAGRWAAAIDWSRVHVLLGDERCVPPDHPDSNYRMARESLLDRVPIPRRQVHRWLAEDPEPAREAARMDGLLRALFPGGPPRLDLVLLGLGPDGHVASLFPGGAALEATSAWAAATPPRAGHARLTLTIPAIQAARSVLLLASGREKAWAAGEAWRGAGPLPVQRIRPASGELTLVLDAAAAAAARRVP